MRSLILFLMLVVPALGQEIKASIKGPNTALAGTLVFLSYEDAKGDNKVWIIPDDLKSQSASCGANVFFSIPTPGEYKFGLIVADKQANIDYSWHTITVTASIVESPQPPVTNPKPGDPPNYESIRLTSRAATETLQDPTTASLLTSSIANLIPKLPTYLPDAKGMVTSTIETCFGMRPPASRSKDWLNIWRIPVDKEIAKANPRTIEEYRECLKAVVRGLCLNGTCPNL
jgi:hypothetical protein